MSEVTFRSGRFDGLDASVPKPDAIGLSNAFQVTAEQYRAALARQGDVCAVCERTERDMRADFHPSTHALRGVLCHSCFSALALTGYDAGRLQAMIGYLRDVGVDS